MLHRRRRAFGVDFSGASDGGRNIWIASGVIRGDALCIEGCFRAEDLPGSGRERARCLAALRDFIHGEGGAAFGLDFPFGLPATLVKDQTWEDFARAFPRRYGTPAQFREACLTAAGGRELRRVTDGERRTPFSPYNLRLYRQTYFGICDLLVPLVASRSACVLPMQRALPHKPWVLEICPASLLKRHNLYLPYKGNGAGRRAARARILGCLERAGALRLAAQRLRDAVLDNPKGDALDSVLAALATFRALRAPLHPAPADHKAYAIEGYVYI